MAEDESEEIDHPKAGKSGRIIGLVLVMVGAGVGYAYTSGMFAGDDHASGSLSATSFADDLAYVSVEPMTVSLGNPVDRRFLRFRAELEVASAFQADVEKMLPRVVDVLNTYLQSLDMADVEDPSSLLTLRSQMRRRVDLVVGGDKVHDLLVMEFVVN